MKAKLIISILAFVLLNLTVYSQCNNDLVDLAIAQSGQDAVFVREFKVKLQKGSVKTPNPTGKFNVYLKEKTNYRFNVASDKVSGAEAILQLYKDGQLVANTFDEANKENNKAFNYVAGKTGFFQVLVFFNEGKVGCAVGIMSMITDMKNKPDSVLGAKNEEIEVLYLNLENPVSIVTDKELSDSILFEIDNGLFLQKGENYFIVPGNEGLATLKVIIKDNHGNVKEEAKSDFLVRRLPVPKSSIHGLQGGIITRSTLQLASNLEINFPINYEKYGYEVVDFIVKAENKGVKRMLNSGRDFNHSVRSFLAEIPEETRLIIESINVRTPKGQIITLEPLSFIVR